ncbi:MAG: methyltransferase domain-containing protein [Alphaproteobacteria bacterium]|nr:methyltransferase domain-containing protein [Alphaproteobacteria bacterium]
MADTLGMDPARIERLRSPERLEYFHPDRIWEVLKPAPGCTLVDIGAGVGFLTLPFAERFPQAKAYGCDILEGMVGLLRQDAAERGHGNLEALLMAPNSIDLPDNSADFITMGQLHHELDAPEPLMAECKRLLKPGGTIAIIDWADADNGKSPPVGRRVPVAVMRAQLKGVGFTGVDTHDVYEFHTFMTATA